MSKKGTSNILGLLAFIALMIAGVLMLIALINSTGAITIGGQIINIMNLISYICLVIVVIFAGWSYASSLALVWKIIYIVVAVLAICGAFGFINFRA